MSIPSSPHGSSFAVWRPGLGARGAEDLVGQGWELTVRVILQKLPLTQPPQFIKTCFSPWQDK